MLVTNPKQLQIEYAHLKLPKDVLATSDKFFKQNALIRTDKFDIENPHIHTLKVMRNPENFYFTCKYLFGIELLPFQCVVLQELWNRKFPMLIGTRGFSKSFMLALYGMLKAVLCQGTKVVVVGAGLRQSKHLFNYCEKFWFQSNVLRSIFGGYQGKAAGPKVSNDRYLFNLGDSTMTFLPIGTGDKIRGERASVLILDEFACVDRWTLVETADGLKRICDFVDLVDPVINKDGDYEKPELFNVTPLTDVYEITTEYGFRFKCSKHHMAHTDKNWKQASELVEGDILPVENKYNWPKESELLKSPAEAKILGLLFGLEATFTKDLITLDTDNFPARKELLESLEAAGIEYREYNDGILIIKNIWGMSNSDRLPNAILSCPKESFKLFINGMFKYRHRMRSDRDACEMLVDKPRLRQDIHIMLFKMNILTSNCTEGYLKFHHKGNWELFNIIEGKGEFNHPKLARNPRVTSLKVVSVKLLDYKDNLYDFYLPKTNSFYGDCFIQHNTIPPDIYENVIAGFAAVSSNPVASAKLAARKEVYREFGMDGELSEIKELMGNQTILAGTAFYEFNHFAKYWQRYRTIIESKGDPKKLAHLFDDGQVPPGFNWKDFSVIRIPYYMLPKDFMDEGQVARSKANVHSGIFSMEFLAIFCKDSEGFFKRSLLESCVVKNMLYTANGVMVEPFDASLWGNHKKEYIYGIDPAAERDNFAITVLEVTPEYRKIVYVWTINKKEFQKKLADGYAKKDDYYGYCARKIRDLMKVFPTNAIAIDSQGGGGAVCEALHDSDKIETGEQPLWPIIEEDKEQYSDSQRGLHILHMINFADAAWVSDANHGMKKDFEDRVLLFPRFNTANLAEAIAIGELEKTRYDTLEDCLFDIEELKNELSSIVHSQTGIAGRDRWDTPETKEPGGKKGRLRKDRYSALVMANMVARSFQRDLKPDTTSFTLSGGFPDYFNDYSVENDNKLPPWMDTGWDDGVIMV